MVFRIALTGGIASGKSTVAARFAELDIPVIDTDLLAREVVAPGSDGLAQVAAHFGPSVLAADGSMDRAAMRQLVFSNSDAKQALEAILHPLIGGLVSRRSKSASGPYQILEIPLYTETGGRIKADRVLVVDCDPDVQIARVMARDNSTREQAESILARQATRRQRLDIADDVIVNDKNLHALSDAVYQLHRRYLDMAQRPHFFTR